MPKVGSAVRYFSSGNKKTTRIRKVIHVLDLAVVMMETNLVKRWPRKAVDERLHHLMVMTTSPSSRLVSPVFSSSNHRAIRPEDSTRGSSGKPRHRSQSGPYHFTSMNPPPPPMRDLPPFKILSDEETAEILEKMVALSSLSGRKAILGWSRQNAQSRIACKSRGQKANTFGLLHYSLYPTSSFRKMNLTLSMLKSDRPRERLSIDIDEDDEEEFTHEKKTALFTSLRLCLPNIDAP
ncbi:hypothetical protein CPB86DRAFT_253682 [Serendipita vermifera]|nr:hypothetical protein CPB86DRAFT_253682 [Serendipita vermifera]